MSLQELGRVGEDIALLCYRIDGFDCLARRFRKACGELDLVLRRDTLLVFVEVKTRRGTTCGRAAESVTPRKVAVMRQTARAYLDAHREHRGLSYRFDVAAIDFSRDLGEAHIELLRGII